MAQIPTNVNKTSFPEVNPVMNAVFALISRKPIDHQGSIMLASRLMTLTIQSTTMRRS
jgi:hypothetical protein